jgi:hypothetical protein
MQMRNVLMEEAGGAGATGGGAAKPWYDGVAGVDPAIVGHWTNKGWHTKTAPEVALEATKAWKAAEGFVGVPADQILRMPKDAADEAGWNTVYNKLGRPTDAAGYDLSAVKRADGTALDADTEAFIRERAFKLNLPKDKAAELASEIVKREDSTRAAAEVEKQAKLVEQKTALDKNWGPNKEANLFIAKRAAQALGVDPATVAALENQVGYDKVMNMFLSIGQKIGEDNFVSNTNNSGAPGVMTRDQAVAKIADLKGDEVWRKAYLNGDAVKKREMEALHVIAYSR